MFEHRVQADHCNAQRREGRMDALRLRQPVLHAGRTQHLECVQYHHFAAQVGQLQGVARVEPLARRPRRRGPAGRVEAEPVGHRRRRCWDCSAHAITF